MNEEVIINHWMTIGKSTKKAAFYRLIDRNDVDKLDTIFREKAELEEIIDFVDDKVYSTWRYCQTQTHSLFSLKSYVWFKTAS